MKRLLALLLLCLTPVAFGQVDYTITQTPAGSSIPLQNINQNQGTPLNLGDDSISSPINLGFSFTFYGQSFNSARISNNGVISFQNPIGGCCSGYNLSNPGNEYGIFAFQTDLLNMSGTTNPYYKSYGSEGSKEFTIGWYNMPVFADPNFRNTFEITLFEGSNNILLNYGDMNTGGRLYTAGIKGSNADGAEILYSGTDGNFLDFKSWTFSSGPPPPPPIPEFLYWNKLVDENGSFTLTQPGVVRYGASGVYVYQSLQAGTYECSNSAWNGDPIGGVFKSCELGSNEAPVVAIDCAINPADPSCVIDSIIDDGVVDPVEQAIADATDTTDESLVDSGSDDGSSDGSEIIDEEEEETLVADDETAEETNLEELLQENDLSDAEEETLIADDDIIENLVDRSAETTTSVAAIADENKANDLADSISKNVLEGALAIAATNVAAASTTAAASSVSSDNSSNRINSSTSSSTVVAVSENVTAETKSDDTKQEVIESAVASSDAVEVGRQIGAAALAAIITASETSASESTTQAESIATASNENNQTNIIQEPNNNVVVTENTSEISASIINTELQNEQSEEQRDINVVVADTQSTEFIDTFADLMRLEIKPTEEKKDEDLEFVQQLAATSNDQKQDDVNNTGFSEDEKVTIANDPALANAFNLAPNINNLEVAGVLNQKQEEKSDAEKAADKVVAANAKEQEEINKNYMDADQSGIVAAMGADTDVASYRTAMIQDNNIWYKPEDIYKNIVYKDNVRGSYFLEKGNTDTYKKMVEEQYK